MGFSRAIARFRGIAPRRLIAASALSAVIAVAVGLAGRQEATRSAAHAYIPMRALRPEEAAALLRTPSRDTTILALSADELVIGTRNYALPIPGGYRTTRANFGDNYARHVLPRAPVERALGRSLDADPVAPQAFRDGTLSFSPSYVWLYAVGEVLFLTVWLSLASTAAQRVRRVSLVLPLLWLWAAILVLFVNWYSPAFFDADFFYQRIVVEEIAVLGALAAVGLLLPALISLAFYAVREGSAPWR